MNTKKILMIVALVSTLGFIPFLNTSAATQISSSTLTHHIQGMQCNASTTQINGHDDNGNSICVTIMVYADCSSLQVTRGGSCDTVQTSGNQNNAAQ